MISIKQALKERVLILDGAMGTMIQKYNLTEADYRGERFAQLPGQMKGNNDMLTLTRPDIIQAIHDQYLNAGADIIETNTFNSTSISLSDYGMEAYVRELNIAAAKNAREVADRYTKSNPAKPRFVAGSIGPTNKTASISPDVSNPAYRAITFDELFESFKEQIDALVEGGVDVLLFETVFDTLNLKAAFMAAEQVMRNRNKKIPMMLSFTVAGMSGRILSGQTLAAAWASVSHADWLSVGLNCSFGAKSMKPFIKELGRIAPCYISAYPNAGLPNTLGEYDETPEMMAGQIKEYIEEGLVNIIGGCCGTTPDHIAEYRRLVENAKPRRPSSKNPNLILSGLDVLEISPLRNFINIGERCNVAGSRKFLRLIQEKNYEEALRIAGKQVEDGAQILDINVDDGLWDSAFEMTNFLNLMASEPDIAKVPVMIDSSDWMVIENGLKVLQGKSIVNSISLKNGEKDFLEKARIIRSYGAAVVAMAFDEKGQADTFERKIAVCERMYNLLVHQAGYEPSSIIFDPNVLAIATGIEEHNAYALAFIRAIEWIKQNLPGAKVSGGISNLSFSFRGNNYLREAMHSVFLYHAIQKGLDMGIVNSSTSILYEDIPHDLLGLIEDAVLDRSPEAAEKLIEYAQAGDRTVVRKEERQDEWRTLPVDERLKYALIKGNADFLEEDLREALNLYPRPIDIIDQPLMEGMNTVGTLFGEGKMFLPQVVKTARTMKKAVSILQPAIEAEKYGKVEKTGKILIATVKGDVHDIGKNITSVVLSCNNYEMIDLGVMVPPEEIISKAKEHQVDIVALSGLITPSLQEMSYVASEMEKAGFTIPLIIGGATTSTLHTALKIAPLYQGAVVHVKDASQAVPVVNSLRNTAGKENYIKSIKEEYARLRVNTGRKRELVSLKYARKHPWMSNFSSYKSTEPVTIGARVLDYIPLEQVIPYIHWSGFLAAWKLPVKYTSLESNDGLKEEEKVKAREAFDLLQEAKHLLEQWIKEKKQMLRAIIGFYPVSVQDESFLLEGNRIPVLRQQEKQEDDRYKSLVDFIHSEGDYIGLFVVTAGENELVCGEQCHCHSSGDTYLQLLEQTLRDRLVEAATEYVHEKVRKEYWGYAPDEAFTSQDLWRSPYQGIRPASGYPGQPDLSFNFVIDRLLGMERIGVKLTPNGALSPSSTTAGMYLSHPEANYFRIGTIGYDQLTEYARKKGITEEEACKWLGI